jgi:hypothetical protein
MQAIGRLLRNNAKAIVAFLATALAATVGFDVPMDVQVAVTSLIVAFATWLIPNKA